LLEDAQQISKEVFLQVLAESHRETAKLVSELHEFDTSVIAASTGSFALAGMLDRCFEDLYVPYVDDGRYQSIERWWLQSVIDSEMQQFNETVDQYQATKGKGLSRKMSSPTKDNPTGLTVSALFSQVTTTMTNMAVELKNVNLAQGSASQDIKHIDAVLTVDTALRCIKAAHSSVERAKELCRPSELYVHFT
jgi:hypothetical protein